VDAVFERTVPTAVSVEMHSGGSIVATEEAATDFWQPKSAGKPGIAAPEGKKGY
jgi:hypothetical protein